MFDDLDLYDDDDDDLAAIRRAAAAKRRKMLQENGDALEALGKAFTSAAYLYIFNCTNPFFIQIAQNPKTAAFAKAAKAVMDESCITSIDLSDDDDDPIDTEENKERTLNAYLEDDDDDDDEDKKDGNNGTFISDDDEDAEEELPYIICPLPASIQ